MTSESRRQFQQWVCDGGLEKKRDLQHDYAQDSTWYASLGWSARDSEVERLREALQGMVNMYEEGATLHGLVEDMLNTARSLLSSQVKESGK